MQANELHDFAGRGHGDLVGALWGYLGQWTACGGSSLPPTLEGFPPVPHFFAAFGCHRAPSSPNAGMIRLDVLPRHLLADRRKCIVYGRGIPYGERLHASRESAPWQRRNT